MFSPICCLSQKNEAERAELPGQIGELQAEAGRLTEQLQAAESALEALDKDCRGEREDVTRQQQVRLMVHGVQLMRIEVHPARHGSGRSHSPAADFFCAAVLCLTPTTQCQMFR